MTDDEQMAHDYAIENWEHYEEGQNDYAALKQAFLAGLTVGRGNQKGQRCVETLIKGAMMLQGV